MSVRGAILCLAIGAVAPGFVWAQGLPPEMPVSRADLLVRKAGGTLIDVRTPESWAQTGVPLTAHAISFQSPNFLSSVAEVVGNDKSTPIVLICRTGDVSAKAREKLLAAGYENVTVMEGGISGPNGWIDADLPLRPYSE